MDLMTKIQKQLIGKWKVLEEEKAALESKLKGQNIESSNTNSKIYILHSI